MTKGKYQPKDSELLPLGTAVSIAGDESKYLLMARSFKKYGNGVYQAVYRGVPHPFGAGAGYQVIVINAEDIQAVDHLGYEDELDQDMVKSLQGKAEVVEGEGKVVAGDKAKTPPAPSPPPLPAEKQAPEKETLTDPYDPFYELRNRGKMTYQNKETNNGS